jgi:lipoate-protein ligase A
MAVKAATGAFKKPALISPSASLMAGTPWVLLPSLIAPGDLQMELDLWMLAQLKQTNGPAAFLRFYRWANPCLSIGRHQQMPFAPSHLPIVRRPTGGSSVLHGSDLCYALALRAPPQGRRLCYHCINHWLCSAMEQLGEKLNQGSQPQTGAENHCFASSTDADLVDQSGIKRIGSAQLWQRGHLLQHGSIQLQPPLEAWQEIFDQPAPAPFSKAVDQELLEQALITNASDWLFANQPLRWDWPDAALTSGRAATLSAIGARDNPNGYPPCLRACSSNC